MAFTLALLACLLTWFLSAGFSRIFPRFLSFPQPRPPGLQAILTGVVTVGWLLVVLLAFFTGAWMIFLGGIFLCGGTFFGARVWCQAYRRRLEKEGVAFFYGLQGLVRGGISLPNALFHLVDSLEGHLGRLFRSELGRFEKGRPLSDCLQAFQLRSSLSTMGICLDILDSAYRRGLPVLPLLEKILPWLESEWDQKERWRLVWRGVWGQVVFASSFPWLILGFYSWTDSPALFQDGRFPWLCLVTVVFQSGGLWWLRRHCRFY